MFERRIFGVFLAGALGLASWIGPAEGSEDRRITVDLKDAELHDVLRLFSDVGKVNVVVSEDVKGKVTLHLVDVRWSEALLLVLESKSLGLERQGNVYLVDTLERITARAMAKDKLARMRKAAAPLRTVLIPLAHARAKSLAPIVRGMLTSRGRVEVDERTNTLIVTDVAESAKSAEETFGSDAR